MAKSFHLTLLLASIVPYILLTLQYAGATGVAVVLAVIGFFATGHVPATLYLLRDPDVRRRIIGEPWFMIWLPVGVMAGTFAVFLLLAQNVNGSAPFAVYGLMLGYTLWQTWHFAKQNVGVYSFSCIAAKRGPMTKNERKAIVFGGVAGVLGVYQAVGQSLHQTYWPQGSLDWMHSLFNGLWYVGIGLLVASSTLATAALWQRRNEQLNISNVLLLVMCALFFTPYFFTGDALMTFFFFTWAHGLQYLTFLGFHALAQRRKQHSTIKDDVRRASEWFGRLEPVKAWAGVALTLVFFAFCGLLVRDLIVWAQNFLTFTAMFIHIQINWPIVLNLVVAFLTGITMVHFIWDSRLWRMRDKDRRDWMRDRYDFLFEEAPERPRRAEVPVVASTNSTS